MSSTRRIFNFPFSTALVIDSCSELAVLVNGTSRITSVLLSSFSIFALTLSVPPLAPSLYRETSMLPPVAKSGKILNSSPRRYFTAESQISFRLWGRIFDDSPTAIPSAPWASRSGNFTGSVMGSL